VTDFIAQLAANPEAVLHEPLPDPADTDEEDLFAGVSEPDDISLDEDPAPEPEFPAADLTEPEEAPPRPISLVGIAQSEAELFASPDGTPYGGISVRGHREIWPLRSSGFKEWLVRRYYDENGRVPKSQNLTEALNVISGDARFKGETHTVHLRVAGNDQAVYLDLANDAWEAVEVTAAGWRVVADAPVRFRRTANTAALPRPEGGGSLDLLRDLVNVPNEDGWRLLIGWLLFTLSPSGPYPVLLLHGEQGSAKSTAERVLRTLVDPNHSPLRAAPKEEQDLLVACHNCWIVALDNLSGIQDWLSDALCRIASGTGLAKRMLYTDAEEVVLHATRPIALNGITELATRGDLLDRSILVDLEAIPENRRLPEKALWRRFEELQPLILGALLDALVGALRNRATTSLPRLPRMADFALFVTAAEEALGWAPGSFAEAYDANRRASNDISIESSVVGPAIRALIEAHGVWTGTAGELRRELEKWTDETLVKSRFWPKNPWALGNQLDRLGPNLRAVGIGVFRPKTRTSRGRLVSLWDIALHGPNPPASGAGDAGDAAPAPSTPAPDGLWPDEEEGG
jgi:hypothetical protein